MALTTKDREALSSDFQREASNEWLALPLSKPDLAKTVAAADDWIDANMASFLTAMSAEASKLSDKIQTRLFVRVLLRKWEVM